MTFQSGNQIGIYILTKRIGRGGFGEVWLAERRAKFVTTKVAVKLPLDEQVDIEAIHQEAVLWEQASGHPNILPIIDADEYDGQIVIVSEYAPDGSIEDVLKSEGKLSIKKSAELTIGILSGLDFLHSKKIIHRDIKPANILLQGETPRLADFGISRVMKTTSLSINISGTPPYMAPEAFDRKRNAQTDIWSVGVILYQMIKGSLPFPQNNLTDFLGALVNGEAEPLPESTPLDLQQIINKALAKEITNRYQSAKEMKDDLSDFIVSLSQQSDLPTRRLVQPQSINIPTEILPIEKLNPTLASPTLKSPNIFPETANQELEITQQLDGILELPKSNTRRSRFLHLKLIVPFITLVVLTIGGLYYFINQSTISNNSSSNTRTQTSSNVSKRDFMTGDEVLVPDSDNLTTFFVWSKVKKDEGEILDVSSYKGNWKVPEAFAHTVADLKLLTPYGLKPGDIILFENDESEAEGAWNIGKIINNSNGNLLIDCADPLSRRKYTDNQLKEISQPKNISKPNQSTIDEMKLRMFWLN